MKDCTALYGDIKVLEKAIDLGEKSATVSSCMALSCFSCVQEVLQDDKGCLFYCYKTLEEALINRYFIDIAY